MTEWYRNSKWNSDIESNFFEKLTRARSQKEQYVVIQALEISDAYPDIALKLVDYFFSIKVRDSEVLRALLARSKAYLAKGLTDSAISTMKEMLEIERRKPSHKTNVFVDYPFLVAEQKISSEYESAIAVLVERAGDLVFPISHFKWHAAMSNIQAHLGNTQVARQHAELALEAAQIKKSGFRFHQDLGLVGKEYLETVRRLRDH